MTEVATETDVIRPTTATKPLASPTTTSIDERKEEGEEEIENLVEQPLLQLCKEVSRAK